VGSDSDDCRVCQVMQAQLAADDAALAADAAGHYAAAAIEAAEERRA
jgi:hypothetical protein